MQVELVLTINAEDRPGLVETVAQEIVDHSGNWVDSAMSRLSGSFAGIVKVSVSQNDAAALEKSLLDLHAKGIEVTVRRGHEVGSATDRHAQLELVGQDHAGIILQVTRLLAAQSVNVEEMETSVFIASMSGERMFMAEANISLPSNLSLDDLGEALESLAQDLMVDIKLQDEKS